MTSGGGGLASNLPPVRQASAADVLAVAEFQTECWREAYAGLVPQDYLDRVGVGERAARWNARISDATRHVALAQRAGTVIGVVSWGLAEVQDAPARELKSLYVAAAFRGSGLAGRLLRYALGDRPAHLWVFEANARAHRFYVKHRFHPDGFRQLDPGTGLLERRLVRP